MTYKQQGYFSLSYYFLCRTKNTLYSLFRHAFWYRYPRTKGPNYQDDEGPAYRVEPDDRDGPHKYMDQNRENEKSRIQDEIILRQEIRIGLR